MARMGAFKGPLAVPEAVQEARSGIRHGGLELEVQCGKPRAKGSKIEDRGWSEGQPEARQGHAATAEERRLVDLEGDKVAGTVMMDGLAAPPSQ